MCREAVSYKTMDGSERTGYFPFGHPVDEEVLLMSYVILVLTKDRRTTLSYEYITHRGLELAFIWSHRYSHRCKVDLFNFTT